MFMLWIGIDFVACVAISPKSELFSCRNFMAVCLSAWIASHSVRVGEVDMRFCLPIRYSDALDFWGAMTKAPWVLWRIVNGDLN